MFEASTVSTWSLERKTKPSGMLPIIAHLVPAFSFVGKPVPIEIEWDSLRTKVSGVPEAAENTVGF
jgi:hypothetical protein